MTDERKIIHLSDNLQDRYFLDIRVGCAAVRDRKHTRYDETYPGLHQDTPDVVLYKHGTNPVGGMGWVVKEEDIEENLETIEGNTTIKASLNTLQFGLIGGAKKKEGMNHLGIPEHIAKEREALFRAKQLETFRGGKGGRREHR